eukprot:462562-Hanusia_phi.AAC.1
MLFRRNFTDPRNIIDSNHPTYKRLKNKARIISRKKRKDWMPSKASLKYLTCPLGPRSCKLLPAP